MVERSVQIFTLLVLGGYGQTVARTIMISVIRHN